MKRKSLLLLFVCLTLLAHAVKVNVKNAVDFVNPLVGSDSNPELSTGNTYPARHLYGYSGQPWKTQYWIRQVMDKLYTPAPDGYCGVSPF